MALRRLRLRLEALAWPPFDAPSVDSATAAGLRVSLVSSSSPVAIRITRTAFPMTSAGRFCPCGPFGMVRSYRRSGRPKPGGRFQTETLPTVEQFAASVALKKAGGSK